MVLLSILVEQQEITFDYVLLSEGLKFFFILSYDIIIENTSRKSFDIKFTRQGFENAC